MKAREYVPLRNVENGLELELTLDGEVLDGKVFFPVVGQALVESTVLVGSDILGIPRPDGLGLVELLVLNRDLLDLLLLLWLFFILVFDFLDLGLVLVIFLGLFLDLFLVVFNLLWGD